MRYATRQVHLAVHLPVNTSLRISFVVLQRTMSATKQRRVQGPGRAVLPILLQLTEPSVVTTEMASAVHQAFAPVVTNNAELKVPLWVSQGPARKPSTPVPSPVRILGPEATIASSWMARSPTD